MLTFTSRIYLRFQLEMMIKDRLWMCVWWEWRRYAMMTRGKNLFAGIEWNSFFAINKPLIFIRAIGVVQMHNIRIFQEIRIFIVCWFHHRHRQKFCYTSIQSSPNKDGSFDLNVSERPKSTVHVHELTLVFCLCE